MKKNSLARILGYTAVGIAVLGFAVWIIAGARIGWTQTSVVAMHRDEITGIDYPVRQAAFIPGVEVPLVGTAVAVSLGLIAHVARRRREPAVEAR